MVKTEDATEVFIAASGEVAQGLIRKTGCTPEIAIRLAVETLFDRLLTDRPELAEKVVARYLAMSAA